MADGARTYHISSAIVTVRPDAQDAMVAALGALENVEVHAAENGKIVIVIEGATAGELGASLSQITFMDGVYAANMVYEHIEEEEATSDDRGTDAS